MSDVRLIWRPIDRWPRSQTVERERSDFRKMDKVETVSGSTRRQRGAEIGWVETRDVLIRELRMIGVLEAQVQLAIEEKDIRIDGEIKANARLKHPGVVLSFVHPRLGPMMYACDRWTSWQSNVRGIAKGLEALRLVERYGITSSNEQYLGFRALPPGTPMPAAQMTVEEAAVYFIEKAHPTSDVRYGANQVIEDPALRERIYRQGAKRLHPDLGGSHEEWTRFEQAKRVLDEYAS